VLTKALRVLESTLTGTMTATGGVIYVTHTQTHTRARAHTHTRTLSLSIYIYMDGWMDGQTDGLRIVCLLY